MRNKYRVTYLDLTTVTTKEKNMFGEDVEGRYRMLRAVDGTFFGNEPIVFTGACPADDDYRINDVISAEIRDPRQPTYLHEVMLESRYVEPALLVEPEPITIPEPPVESAPQADELLVAIMNGQYLSHLDLLALARRFVVLEKQFKALEARIKAVEQGGKN